MAINVNAANNQAAQINNQIAKLRDAKRQMQLYRSSVTNNWQGKEVAYILTAIDRVVGDIDSAIRNMESLGGDIKTVAAQIKREEDAAAAAARARQAKQQRIREAEAALNTAQQELDGLLETRKQLEKALKKASWVKKLSLQRDLEGLNKEIEKAQQKYQGACDALQAARG